MFNKIPLILSAMLIMASFAGCGAGDQTTVTFNNGGSGGPATGVVVLTWDAPITRTDGSSLNPVTDVQSYQIYYGTAPGVYTRSVYVPNPGIATITHTFNIAKGTYYFAVTDTDLYGVESGYSTEISKTI